MMDNNEPDNSNNVSSEGESSEEEGEQGGGTKEGKSAPKKTGFFAKTFGGHTRKR